MELLNSGSPIDDLNDSPSQYNISSSQYHASGSTFEETDVEATNIASASQRPKKQSTRSSNFTIDEDKLLVSAWLNVSLDPVKGSDQKKSQFWKRVTEYFAKNKTWGADRSEKSLTSRWTTINTIVSKFSGHYNQVQHLRRSGSTEEDKFVEAKEMFKKVEGHAFQLDHCWKIMRFQQKWMDEHQRIDGKRKCKGSSAKTTKYFNLEEDEECPSQPEGLKRPIGRKAATEVNKKAKLDESTTTVSKTRVELEELRERRIESDRIKSENLKSLLANEQKQVALREKEYELQVMAMDMTKLSPIQVEYFTSLQREILTKRVGGSGNE